MVQLIKVIELVKMVQLAKNTKQLKWFNWKKLIIQPVKTFTPIKINPTTSNDPTSQNFQVVI